MKKLLFLFSILLSLGLHAQKTLPKSAAKPKSLDEMYPNKHTLISANRDLKFGWEVSLKLNSRVKDDSMAYFEVLRADSTLYYAAIMYPEYATVEKGQVLKRFMEITADSIAPTDRFAPMGTYADFYPIDSLGEGKASIMFLGATLPNVEGTVYLLPDFDATNGVFHVGDTIELVDHLGVKCTGKIAVLESNCEAYGTTRISPISFVIPSFSVPTKFYVSLIYTKLSGEDVGEKISVTKVH